MKFFKKRGFLVFLGLLLLSLFIWFAGPYFAFADYKPLESALARLIAIGLLLLVFAIWALVKWLIARLAGAKLSQAVVENAAPAASATGRDAVQLRERFEEAVATLRKPRKTAAVCTTCRGTSSSARRVRARRRCCSIRA